ncbi:MAG: HD domain-containing protein [Candidatus Saganbacteria bacterium]|nr:HD domain-containing protein [Candidatus Saganbacteria bacterium]
MSLNIRNIGGPKGPARVERNPVGQRLTLESIITARSDAAFRDQLDSYNAFLRLLPPANTLLEMMGMQQTPIHGGMDPLIHTFNALECLETDEIAKEIKTADGIERPLAELVRIAVLYHDIGKVNDPFNPDHAADSAEIAESLLANPELSGVGALNDNEIELVLLLIRSHDLLGNIVRNYKIKAGSNPPLRIIQQELGSYNNKSLTLKDLFLLHSAVALADIGSIPGLLSKIQRITKSCKIIIGRLVDVNLSPAPSSVKVKRIHEQAGSAMTLKNQMWRQNRFIAGLMSKIRQNVLQTVISFNTDSIVLETMGSEIEYEDGKHIGRTFLRAGISRIVFSDLIDSNALSAVANLMAFGLESRSGDLDPQELMKLPFVEEVNLHTDDDLVMDDIPGKYKHYTSETNFDSITSNRTIEARAHSKNGTILTGVYLSTLSLTPAEAFDTLFANEPHYADCVTHVIGFNIIDPELERRIKKRGIELLFEEDISFDDPRIKIRYKGKNRIQNQKEAVA